MIDVTTSWSIWFALGTVLIVTAWKRLELGINRNKAEGKTEKEAWALSQTNGNKEIMADCAYVEQTSAGIMAVVADGIGKENTGKVCAQIAVDTILDAFQPYQVLNEPDYLLRTSFLEANSRIHKTIGRRRGGASAGAVFSNGHRLHYGVAGNVKIALFRNGELIPLNQGQTVGSLAEEAYKEGRITRAETIWSMENRQLWNYLGKDGFHGAEVCDPPVSLYPGDVILLATQGIYEELSWAEMEEILLKDMTIKEKADAMVMETEKKSSQQKENGSVLLIRTGGNR